MKFRKQVSLNHAPLTDGEIQNLQMRQGLLSNADAEIGKWQGIKAMLIDADNLYKREILKSKKLREGKQYVFNYEHKMVHRPKSKPWENGEVPKKISNEDPVENGAPVKETEDA